MNYLKITVLALVLLATVPALSGAADWSAWTRVDDGALNGIEFSHRSDCPKKGKNAECCLTWRFRSFYEEPVELEYTLSWNTAKGGKSQTSKITCLPGENSSVTFAISGLSLEDVAVRVLQPDSKEQGWSQWALLDDGALNGVEFSHRTDCSTRGKDGTCSLRWRFLSRYDETVEIESTISWGTAKGFKQKKERIRLKPGVNTLPAFSVTGVALEEVSARLIADPQTIVAARQTYQEEQQRRQQDETSKQDQERKAQDRLRFAEATRKEQQRRDDEKRRKEEEVRQRAEEERRKAEEARRQAEEEHRRDEEARERRQREDEEAELERRQEERRRTARLREAQEDQGDPNFFANMNRKIENSFRETGEQLRRNDQETRRLLAQTKREQEQREREEREAAQERREEQQRKKEAAERARQEREDKERRQREEERRERERKEKDRERKQVEQRAKEEEDTAKQLYLDKLAAGTRLKARTCIGGDGKYYLVGTYPKISPKSVACIDIGYRATCPGDVVGVTGVARNFLGVSTDCYMGDAVPIEPKPGCSVDQVRVSVISVTPCK